jgi:competence protein ComEA
MPNVRPPERSPWPRLSLKRANQPAAALLLAISLLLLGGMWVYQGRFRGRLIEIDRAERRVIDFKIDINTANWPELCLMPGIGEQLSKRIVDDRTNNGPFRDFGDLRRVRGIGPKTLEGMKPYLLPLADVEATAGDNVGQASRLPYN